jgi:ribonuclease D
MKINTYENDLPEEFLNNSVVAIDTETTGLCPHRDRLCLAQFSAGDGSCYLVKFNAYSESHNIIKLLVNKEILKIFHYARFDVMMFYKHFGVMASNIYCTKIASKLARTYAQRHSLLELCRDLLQIELSKEQTCTDWGGENLSRAQLEYAANDVLYLHKLMEKLNIMLKREGRSLIAKHCFDFLPTRVLLDLMVCENYDIFSHGGA